MLPIPKIETSELTPSEGQPHAESQSSMSATTLSPLDSQSRTRAGSATSQLFPPKTPGGASISSSITFVDSEDALKPDPGTEKDFAVENNPFAFSPGQMMKLFNPKSLNAFVALGGLSGIEAGLRSDIDSGLSVDETGISGRITLDEVLSYRKKERNLEGRIEPRPNNTRRVSETKVATKEHFADRIRVYGKNEIPTKKATPLWRLMWIAYNDKVLILLTVAAVISLALGLYETFRTPDPNSTEPQGVDWVEGVAICVAIVIVVLVGSLNDWQKEKAFVRLNAKKDNREVKVIRSGKSFMINVHEILVGDILHLEPGDMIPADGIFISGHNVKCDESSATGESDQLKKTGGEQVMRLLEQGHQNHKDLDPLIISGAKVLEGIGTYIVTSVGVQSSFGKIMMSMRTEPETTPLQKKLDKLASAIAKLGSTAAIVLFFVLLFRFCADLPSDTRQPPEKASAFMDILIVAITVIVVAVPEGLPLAVTLALAFATTRLLKENNLVRILKSCEVMGNATTVCSDKTGTLTTNKMTVVAGTFGGGSSFDDGNEGEISKELEPEVKKMVIQAIAVNSTAFESDEGGETTFVGSKTEMALLHFARDRLAMDALSHERANAEMVQLFPFDSNKKCMGAVVKTKNGFRLYVKGASEIVLEACSNILDVKTGESTDLTTDAHSHIENTINDYAKKSLRTIGLTHRDVSQWPPAGTASDTDPTAADFELVLEDMTFDGVVGIQDPVRPGVPEAVAQCQKAGVKIRMVTGDNLVTAKAIASECGILRSEDELVMEGPTFRALSDNEMTNLLPRLSVLARSSPQDKQILVMKLKSMGETVAVTGDGTNDGPALKAADVGFSMGIAGTEVAKEASSIVLMDDNFASIVKALMWGRAVNDAVAKFLQFQVTVNVTAVLLTFISAVSSSEMHSVLTAVQLLWVNLIMDTFAALALATDPPTPEILDRKPAGKSAPLITINMWKMIIGQAIFQLTVTLILYFAGPKILGYESAEELLELDTMVFNTFVWMQIFNEFNNRRLDNKLNIFAGIQRNYFFIAINCIMVGAQIAIIFVGGKAFSITQIKANQWGICLILAALSLPMGVLVRLFPDHWFAVIARVVGGPVAKVYRATGRLFAKASKKLPSFRHAKSKRLNMKGKNVEEENSAGNMVPEIVVEDEEKGIGR